MKCEKKLEEKYVPDLMELSDFENASGMKSFYVFFLLSYSGSDKFD